MEDNSKIHAGLQSAVRLFNLPSRAIRPGSVLLAYRSESNRRQHTRSGGFRRRWTRTLQLQPCPQLSLGFRTTAGLRVPDHPQNRGSWWFRYRLQRDRTRRWLRTDLRGFYQRGERDLRKCALAVGEWLPD